jgi:hypothetical protein
VSPEFSVSQFLNLQLWFEPGGRRFGPRVGASSFANRKISKTSCAQNIREHRLLPFLLGMFFLYQIEIHDRKKNLLGVRCRPSYLFATTEEREKFDHGGGTGFLNCEEMDGWK